MARDQDVPVKTLTADAAVQSWLDELPAVAAGLDAPPEVRLEVVTDALDAGRGVPLDLVHPVLAGRAHLANAALALLAADAGNDPAQVERAVAECTAATEIAMAATACAVRLELLPRTAALLAGCSARVPTARKRAVRAQLVAVATAVGEAIAEEEATLHHGQAMLAASQALAEGATTLRQKAARTALLTRCLTMATEARHLLACAGALRAAALADSTVADLEARLAR
jgi:hypothetical protein